MMKQTRFALTIVLASVVMGLMASGPVWACPNCRDALAGDVSHGGLVQGLFWSIMFLLSMPFLIFAGLSGYFYYLVQRARHTAPVPSFADRSGASPFRVGSPSAQSIPAGHQDSGHQDSGHQDSGHQLSGQLEVAEV